MPWGCLPQVGRTRDGVIVDASPVHQQRYGNRKEPIDPGWFCPLDGLAGREIPVRGFRETKPPSYRCFRPAKNQRHDTRPEGRKPGHRPTTCFWISRLGIREPTQGMGLRRVGEANAEAGTSRERSDRPMPKGLAPLGLCRVGAIEHFPLRPVDDTEMTASSSPCRETVPPTIH